MDDFGSHFLATRRNHHDHLPTFELRELLDQNQISQFVSNSRQQCQPQLLVGNFPTPKPQGDLALVAIIQKALDVAQLDVVVAVVGARAEFDFLDFNDFLLGFRFSRLFLFGVLEFSVIHEPAHWRHRRG